PMGGFPSPLQTPPPRARETARLVSLQQGRDRLLAALPATARVRPGPHHWALLKRSGWVSRLAAHREPHRLLTAAATVLGGLPESGQLDRRLLAHTATGDPHSLDNATDLGGLVLAEAAACGVVPAGLSRRDAWKALGITPDALTTGLLTLGIHPVGWQVPHGQPVVLPSWTLENAVWPSPPSGGPGWIFITENPSIATAALTRAPDQALRLLCTVGTPSSAELAAIAQLAHRGWNIAVRADFDTAGIRHVHAVLSVVPQATVWRMSATDYLNGLHPTPFEPAQLDLPHLLPTPWDPELHHTMRRHGRPAYEEALVEELRTDLLLGRPGSAPQAAQSEATPPTFTEPEADHR
ncbi:DUF2399 domain-containing protein, partial [Streptomyces sp. NPDC059957]|uniref:DUF2399 domain-containing protein n=1 Tax=Streptomyces sp. NPDC059957 TaxID=3347016 RepID=UPI0036679C8E